MRVLVTGGTGFIGTALVADLLDSGDEVVILSRAAHRGGPRCRFIRSLDDLSGSEQFDAVVNLAGASLAGRRWSAAYKQEIVASRVDTTAALVRLFERLDHPPPVLLSASAIGYYGHQGDAELGEDAATVAGFSQRLCADWEAAALAAQPLGTRVCLLRLGVVLDRQGSALQEMARSFRLGVASWAGSGQQWFSWIHRQDVIRAMRFLLLRGDLEGPFNLCSPQPVRARAFAEALREHYRVLAGMPVPGVAMRALFGEMANELLLNGQRVVPRALQAAGFEFVYPGVGSALAEIYSPRVAAA